MFFQRIQFRLHCLKSNNSISVSPLSISSFCNFSVLSKTVKDSSLQLQRRRPTLCSTANSSTTRYLHCDNRIESQKRCKLLWNYQNKIFDRNNLCASWYSRTRLLDPFVTNTTIIHRRLFRTTPTNKVIPPVILIVLSRLAKVGAVFFGRRARTWWKKLTPEKKAEYSKRAGLNRNVIGGIIGAIGLGAFFYYETHIQEAPVTKRKRFIAFNEQQFNEIAKQELELLLDAHKTHIVPASLGQPLYRRVVQVTQRLLDANTDLDQIHNKEWTVTVVDDDSILNAFVLPCGSIFVFSGILHLCDTDDQLGVILGHEMAHAVLGHGAEQASFLHMVDLIFVLPVAALWALIPSDAAAAVSQWIVSQITELLVTLPYGRAIEIEADKVGLLLAAKACFDIRESTILWKKMALWGEKDGAPQPEWLSTHPSHESRQTQLQELIPESLSVREKCQCPRLPFLDPELKIEQFKKKIQEPVKPYPSLAIPVKVS